ncbi:MAG: metallophosphoesterase family protein [Caulobacteraceae bacterium]
MLRIAHLSDIHFGGENAEAIAAVSHYLRQAPPDLVVVTGDLTASGTSQEFDQARQWVAELGLPVLTTPGNHDTPYFNIALRLFWPFRRFEARFGAPDGVVWRGKDASVFAVNTARGAQWRLNWSKGAIARSQINAAVASFADGRGDAFAIVACHHPLVEMVGGPMSGRVRGGADAAHRLCEAGVDLILSGHVHVPFVWPFPWGDGRTHAAGAGTLSRRERGVPAGFNLVEVAGREVTIAAKAWSGRGFSTWRTWSWKRPQAAAATERSTPSTIIVHKGP